MNNMIKAFGVVFLSFGTAGHILFLVCSSLWNHQFPTAAMCWFTVSLVLLNLLVWEKAV